MIHTPAGHTRLGVKGYELILCMTFSMECVKNNTIIDLEIEFILKFSVGVAKNMTC